MARSIKATAPCRIDLAGGTLDIHPLYLLVPDPSTINLAIHPGVTVEVLVISGDSCEVEIADKGVKFKVSGHGPSNIPQGGELIASILDFFLSRGCPAVRVITRSSSPPGAGLGASSSLCVALVKSLAALTEQEFSDDFFLRLCLDLEVRILGAPGGCQDFVAAMNGGMQEIRYSPAKVKAQRIGIDLEEIAEQITLVYSGQPHHSGMTNWRTFRRFIEGTKTVRSALSEIAYISVQMASALKSGDWKAVRQLLRKEWLQRKRLSSAVSTPVIDSLINGVESMGGAGKVCGAGGGGCVVLLHERDRKIINEIESLVTRSGLLQFEFSPSEKGCQIT